MRNDGTSVETFDGGTEDLSMVGSAVSTNVGFGDSVRDNDVGERDGGAKKSVVGSVVAAATANPSFDDTKVVVCEAPKLKFET